MFYIHFIPSILVLVNMAENGVHEIADQLETLTAQSTAAIQVPVSQDGATGYALRTHFSMEGLTHALLVQLGLISPISMNHSCKMMPLCLNRFQPQVIS